MVMPEVKVNKYISVRLEGGKTYIYIKGERFIQCKSLVLNVARQQSYHVSSIDDALDVIGATHSVIISPEEEFLGHCSNLQAWAEHDYDTRILHRNIAFPLLRRLAEVGDIKALNVFKEEVMHRFLNGSKTVQEFLVEQGYHKLLLKNDVYSLFVSDLEEEAIRTLGLTANKDFLLDTDYFHFENSFVLDKGVVTQLNIYDSIFSELPPCIRDLKSLKVLRIAVDGLKELPQWISELLDLKVLKVSHTGITSLPSEIGLLRKLTTLDLSDNKLATLPKSIGLLRFLVELDLSRNKLSSIPSTIGRLKSLKRLILADNELVNLPESLCNLISLAYLDLSRNTVKVLPSSIISLNSIIKINASFNKINKIPFNIGNLKSIESLDLSFNEISSIPKSIGEMSNAKEISISNNCLTSFPDSFGKLKNLKFLNLNSNPLKKISGSLANIKPYFYLSLCNTNFDEETTVELKKKFKAKISFKSPLDEE